MSAIRVLQIMGKMHGGGVEQVVMNYYRHIDRDIVQFDFLVDKDSTLVPRDEIENLGGHVIEIVPYQHVVEYQQELGHILSVEAYPIVHSHLNALSIFPLRVANAVGVPVRIAHSHSTMGKGEYAKNSMKVILKHFSNIYPTHRLACSKYAGEWLFGKNKQFEVLYNAIDLKSYVFDAKVRKSVRCDLNISDDTFVIGHVGRFMPQKNHRFIFDVFEKLLKLRSNSILICVGSGKSEAYFKQLARIHGISDKVIFLGQRNDVDRIYQGFDAFVLPSLYEGLGLAAIEAQTAGLPCLLSSAVPKESNVNGESIFLPIENPKLWAKKLCSINVGQRIDAPKELFIDYDIKKAAISLTELYRKFYMEMVS